MFFGKRRDKKSPLEEQPLRVAGQSLEEMFYRRAMETVGMWVFGAVFAVVFAAMEWMKFLLDRPPQPLLYTVAAAIVIVAAVLRVRAHFPTLASKYQGVQGERAVGQMLEEMRTKGYRVIHDVPGEGFNVDHVLVGPAGVFVIETKAISKPRRGQAVIKYDGSKVLMNGLEPERDPVVQAKAAVNYIRRIVEADTGRRPTMRGVVLYPGWFVERQPKGVEVWVLNPKGLYPFIEHEDDCLSTDDIADVARAIEKHVRARG